MDWLGKMKKEGHRTFYIVLIPGRLRSLENELGPTKELTRLTTALAGFENDIRSGHPEGRHAVAHPFFGTLPTTDYLRLQAIHARHHRSQLT